MKRATMVRALLVDAGLDPTSIEVDLARRSRPPRPNARRHLRTAQSPRRNHDQMTFGPGRLVVLCGLVPTLVAALLSLYRPAFLQKLGIRRLRHDPARHADPAARRPHRHRRHRRPQPDDHRPVALAARRRRPARLSPARPRRRDGGARHHLRGARSLRRRRAARPTRCWPTRSREGRVVLGYAMTFDRPQRAGARACCTRSAWPSCGATIPPRSRSSTRRARSATCPC